MGAGRGGEGGRCLSLSGKGGGGVGCGGRLFEAGRLLTFSAFKVVKIDPVSPFYPTISMKKAALQWENPQEVRKTSL